MKSAIVSAILPLLFPLLAGAVVPEHWVDENGVHLKGVGPDNAIIYDNDWWSDVFDNNYLWARVSLGRANLRGNIVSRDMWEWDTGYKYPMQQCLDDGAKALDLARRSGLRNIPDVTRGADEVLRRPASQKIEDTIPKPSAGSQLIIEEARKASPDKPLLIVSGGPLTTVANALLLAPDIAPRLVVFNILVSHYGYNGKDGWAAYIVAKQTRYVDWGGRSFWDKNSVFTAKDFEPLPKNPFCDDMRRLIQSNLGQANQLGDGAPLVWLFNPKCWTDVEVHRAEFKAKAVEFSPAKLGEAGDVLVIPKAKTDLKECAAEFFRVLREPALFLGAASAPGASVVTAAVADAAATTVGCDLRVSDNGRFLVSKADGRPFYFLGDTAWELLYKLTREQLIQYLDDRHDKEFTVIQTTLVSIFKGTGPNAQGDRPFANGKPLVTPGNNPDNAEEYDFWDHVEFVATECAKRGMYLSLSTTWSNAVGAINNPTPFEYGKFLGDRFKHVPNIIWIMVGDAGGHGDAKWGEVAKGIAIGTSGTEDYSKVLLSFHPIGPGKTDDIHNREWMSFNLVQTGHDPNKVNVRVNFIPDMYKLTPPKPVMDYEPSYERMWGKCTDSDLRKAVWWAVMAGAFGHTYGHPCIFQFYSGSGKVWDGCKMAWDVALNEPGAHQMRHLRHLIESRPVLSRVPDQTLVTNDFGVTGDHIAATRGDGYAFVYTPTGKSVTVNMGKISGQEVKAWWFNTKSGAVFEIGVFPNRGTKDFTPYSSGNENDWALVLDDVAKGFGTPGEGIFDLPAAAKPRADASSARARPALRTSPTASAAGYPIQFAPFAGVTLHDSFWQPVLERNRTVTIPHNLRMCREMGIVANFERLAGLRDGDYHGLPNWDEFLYKAIEAASYGLMQQPDAALERELDDIIAVLTKAQDTDGYLRTVIQMSERGRGPKKLERWSNLGDNLELYCAGHLFEAGVAHFQATGKRTLLDVALKNAELIDRLFGPGKRVDVCGHEEIEPALVRLYEASGDERWWKLAKFFVDTRGTEAGGRRKRGEFSQDHAPLFEQTEAVGQAPRATYFYSGAADVGRISGDTRYHTALRRLWDNVVTRKLYLNGGIGSRHDNEGFGPAYDLPSQTAYTEVCAAVSFPMWATRMFRVEPDARYFDVIERTLYNNLAAGVSLSGDRYFYACPLASDGKYKFNLGWLPADGKHLPHAEASATRKEWFPCACCPPTLARYLPQVPGFAYATRGNELFVNLFIAGEADVEVGDARWKLRQEGNYPWDGKVKLTLNSENRNPELDTVLVRIPGWARNEPVPSDLYRFAERAGEIAVIAVNGRRWGKALALTNGFARLEREWQSGDVIELDLPMSVRRVIAHPNVKDCAGKVALQRGPILYCFEGADHGGRVSDLALPAESTFTPRRRDDFLGGTTVLEGMLLRGNDGIRATAIPYYLWSNRGAGEMAVWLYNPKCWRGVKVRRAVWRGPATDFVEVAEGETGDVLDIPKARTDLDECRKEFFRVLTNPDLCRR